jgi:peptidoglycan hydrolase-like protein with peptidoglycan-binding domain
MPDFTRDLSYRNPFLRGADVLYVQRALRSLSTATIEADGLFGAQTASAVKEFQAKNGIQVSGTVDKTTWAALLTPPVAPGLSREIKDVTARLLHPQRFRDSVAWRLTSQGIAVNGLPAFGTVGMPTTVQTVLERFGTEIGTAAKGCGVPAELIIATIAVESGGDPAARRNEPGWTTDKDTPDRVSIGLMQTLITTARLMMADPNLQAEWLGIAGNSITAGARYIASQFDGTGYDPPKVACAYNAGGLYYDPSPGNQWRMRQYPIGTPAHANRMVAFFNDCFSLLLSGKAHIDGPSFADVYSAIK